ncbi:MAG TPA: ATP-binding protein [Steroidobacteraceae bacterium]
MRLAFQNRLTLLALLGGLPATIVAAWFAATRAPTIELKVVFILLLLVAWIVCALELRRALTFPLQTLSNLIEAVRYGDYTLRGRRAQENDPLGEVVREINMLAQTLQKQRLASMEATALVETVLEELDTAVFAFDNGSRLKLLNRAASELLGRSRESVIGRTADELGLTELLAGEDVAVRSLVFPARSGRFEVRRRSFRESGLPHTLVVVSDLSRTLREEERRAWQRLIRVIGHEINNSLTPIKSLAATLRDMLARAPQNAPDQSEVLEGLGLIGDRAASLSKFVATYSQLARLPPPAKHPLSLNALLARLVAIDTFARVRIDAPTEIHVEADGGQLEQVLINLLKNAAEATGGEPDSVEVALRRTRDLVILEVRDTGPGIANPDNLFVPFFTTKPGGGGIGLTLSRQIVENHGGTLSLENRTDRTGCIARLTLPA